MLIAEFSTIDTIGGEVPLESLEKVLPWVLVAETCVVGTTVFGVLWRPFSRLFPYPLPVLEPLLVPVFNLLWTPVEEWLFDSIFVSSGISAEVITVRFILQLSPQLVELLYILHLIF